VSIYNEMAGDLAQILDEFGKRVTFEVRELLPVHNLADECHKPLNRNGNALGLFNLQAVLASCFPFLL